MKSFLLVLIASALCFGQGQTTGSFTTQGGWSQPIANSLISLSLTPPSTTLTQGSSAQYTATGTFALGNTSNLTTSVAWGSSNLSIATIGVLTTTRTVNCVGVGTVIITASSGGIFGTSSLTCLTPVVTSADNINCNPDGTWKTATTDGGANLPTSCYYTAIAGTPSNGTVRGPVSTLAALQNAYSLANCGDIVQLTAGSSITGPWSPAAKFCDDQHYITVESTGVSNPNFPAEGNRDFPCNSNVASLPNRPPYPCTNPALLTAALVAPSSNNAVTMNGTDHLRFIGIEFTRVSTPGALIFNIVDLGSANNTGVMTNHIIFDRVWAHGIEASGTFPQLHSADTSTSRFLFTAQSNHVAVIDSYLSDFYDNGGGDGGVHGSANGQSDAQCIGGGSGGIANSGWGVYKFVNNHCEASGEGILLGGAGGPPLTPNGCTIGVNCNLDVPTDIEVRRNYFFKPLSWNGNTTVPVSLGWPVVKNGFEMKIGARALFEGNLIENTWYSAQVGWCWTVAPKNQSDGSGTLPTAPTALTNDFTYRYNYCYNAAYGLGVYQSQDSNCPTCYAQGANRISIHDNVIGDNLNLGNLTSQSAGDELAITAASDPQSLGLNKLQNINISHNTFVKGVRYLFGFGANSTGQIINFTYQNNLGSFATYGVASNPSISGCSTQNSFSFLLSNCVTGTAVVDHNAVFNWNTANGGALGHNWPTNGSGAGNFFYSDSSGPGFSAYGTGDSLGTPSNYALTNLSPLHNMATDGTNLGADIGTLVTKIANVRDSPSQQFTQGNLVINPPSATVELGTSVPFSGDNKAGSNACAWTVASGVGTISAAGIYTAPNSGGSAVVQCIIGSNLQTANVTVTGTAPTPLGDCSAGSAYPNRGVGLYNVCTMVHQENGGTITRKYIVVIPANYVAGQSGLILWIGGGGHGIGPTPSGAPCGVPGSEVAGIGPYIHTVPSPAPVVVCPEGMWRSSSQESWNWVGRTLSAAWLVSQFGSATAITPNDPDYIRQLVLVTVRDLQLNPKKVFMGSDWPSGHWASMMASQAAGINADLFAAIGSYDDSIFNNMDSTFTVRGGVNSPYIGQTLNAPTGPLSVILEPGVTTTAASSFEDMCGTNLPTSGNFYHPLTIDDTMNYWDAANGSNTHAYQATSGSPTSFCLGTFDGSGNGLPSTLMTRKDTGGLFKTEVFAYRFKGNGTGSMWGSFDWNGNDTLGNSGDRRIALDLRVLSPCDFTHPCNQFMDAGTGPASASGYDPLGIFYKFFLNHPKP